ncbi:MAG: hypothetical protein AAGB51_06490 [Planctomycetota bacterium]
MPKFEPDPKICVVCGEDCSDRPRLKNSSGRYACRSCISLRREQREQARADRSRRLEDHDPSEALVDPLVGSFDDASRWMVSDTVQAATHGRHGPQCPLCGTVTRGDGLICDDCRERAIEEAKQESERDGRTDQTPSAPLPPRFPEPRTSPRPDAIDLLERLNEEPPDQTAVTQPAQGISLFQGAAISGILAASVWVILLQLGALEPLWAIPLLGVGIGGGIAIACGPGRSGTHGAVAVATLGLAIALADLGGRELVERREAISNTDDAQQTSLAQSVPPPSGLTPIAGLTVLAGVFAAWGIGSASARPEL